MAQEDLKPETDDEEISPEELDKVSGGGQGGPKEDIFLESNKPQ